MKLTRTQTIVAGSVLFVVLLLVLVFAGVIPGLRGRGEEANREQVVVWGIFDDAQAIREAIGPGVPFTYEARPFETYEADLVNALAAGRGPDVFMVHNTWLPKHADKLAPLFSTAFTIANMRELFPTAVEQDFAPDNGFIYALPLSIDTLAMMYNKDMFDSAGIALPPKTWKEFEEIIPALRRTDSAGSVVRAAAAIGGSTISVNRATDLVSALMLQGGVEMVDPNFGSATFAARGGDALSFYLSFANPANRDVFTWNDQLPYSVDAFAEEKAAVIFNYSYLLAALNEKYPFLRVGVAPLPQPAGATRDVNYPNYWGYAVSKTSVKGNDGWRFVLDLTTNTEAARTYFEKTRRPAALRTLIQATLNDPALGVFAKQALTARSWPQVDNVFVEQAFSQMIQDVLSGQLTVREALEKAQSAITGKMQGRRLQ